MTETTFSQRSDADSRLSAAANSLARRPLERCPTNAGQALVFAGHRKTLTAQRIASKRQHRARHFLYVPLPVSTAFERLRTAAELETFWKLLGNLRACPPEMETFRKRPGSFRVPSALADTTSILSAALTQ
jgi:hypothetical protein